MKRHRTTSIMLVASFAIGTAFGYEALADHGVWSWLAEPGVLLASPIYVLLGGVHGGFTKLWWWSIAPCNGLAYSAIIATALWARRYIQRERA
jgi:hypothetical protein